MSTIKITSLRIPENGERIEVIDPRSQETVQVTLDDVFTAASGKICANFTVVDKNGAKKEQGLACLNDKQEWDKNQLNINLRY